MSMLKGQDILRTDLISDDALRLILATATRFEEVLNGGGLLRNMEGQVLAYQAGGCTGTPLGLARPGHPDGSTRAVVR